LTTSGGRYSTTDDPAIVDNATGGKARATKYLAGDGYVQMYFDLAAPPGAVVELSESSTQHNYTAIKAGMEWHRSDNTLRYLDSGAGFVDTGIEFDTTGQLARIIRTGTVVKLQSSVNAGVDWTDRHTFAYTGTAPLYIWLHNYREGGAYSETDTQIKGYNVTTF
jgi:hypothetical protein